ncbi:hypothetical protein CAPTEDRAFT_189477 [Capitella teleta]|uniref:Ig-like domain-containing protein n=1 Tax=Capitella teleta TaxID=283909 RepID=R7V1B3_CAPTE|nr:hypothetical protein CAPTEDRAFT_189477 [Capitella teleta]|eukprot:ELU12334.1 hypothetical protein CAPTEDRAFT_189477 [Capitella teleta]
MGIIRWIGLFCTLCGHFTSGIPNPACTVGEVPIISLAGQRATTDDGIRILTEHSFPMTSSWAASVEHRGYGMFMLIPDNYTKMTNLVSKHGVDMSECTVLPSVTSIAGEIEQVVATLRTSSGPYDVYVDTTARLGQPRETISGQIMNAPEKQIRLATGQEKTIGMTVNKEVNATSYPMIAAVQRTNLTLGSKQKFQFSFELLKKWPNNGDYNTPTTNVEGLSFNIGAKDGVIEISMTVNSFNPDVHSGYYCFIVAVSIHFDGDTLGACTVLKGTEQVIPRRINIENCDYNLQSTMPAKSALNVGRFDCVKCVGAGFNDGQVVLLKKNLRGERIVLDLDVLEVNSPWLMTSVYHMTNVSADDGGVYTCIALDDDVILKKKFETRAVEPLMLETSGLKASHNQIRQRMTCSANDTAANMTFVQFEWGSEGGDTTISTGSYPCYDVIINNLVSDENKVEREIMIEEKDSIPTCSGEDTSDDLHQWIPILCRVESEFQTESRSMFYVRYDIRKGCCKNPSNYYD